LYLTDPRSLFLTSGNSGRIIAKFAQVVFTDVRVVHSTNEATKFVALLRGLGESARGAADAAQNPLILWEFFLRDRHAVRITDLTKIQPPNWGLEKAFTFKPLGHRDRFSGNQFLATKASEQFSESAVPLGLPPGYGKLKTKHKTQNNTETTERITTALDKRMIGIGT